jgi:hypothetical protein
VATAQQIRAELDADPLSLGYAPLVAAGNDTATAALLNTRAYRGPVPIAELSSLCLSLQLTGKILALDEIPLGGTVAEGVTMTLAIKTLLKQILTLVQTDYRLESADVDDPAFGPGCDGLVALGLLDAAGKTALLALGANRRSRAEVLWGTPVSEVDVAKARGV